MIDLEKIVGRINQRVEEMGASLAEVSARATKSPDTVRNWERAIREDRENGTNKASATTIKLNQIEQALGIELANNASDNGVPPEEAAVKSLLRRISGLPEAAIHPVWISIRGFLEDAGQLSQAQHRDQSASANRRREELPSR